jgi:predicted transcriptional regulator of viral defense system
MAGVRQDLRRGLHAVAYTQGGYFTAAQAVQVGYSYQAQKYHADSGSWVRQERGLFRLPDFPVGPDDAFVRWVVWSGSKGVISHESAAAVHGLGDVDPLRIHLSVPPAFGRTSDVVVLHRAELAPAEIEHRLGWAVTTPARTMLDLAAGELSQELLEGAVRDALERGLISRRALLRMTQASADHPALRLERALATVGTT